jgi:hypothetical protein
VETAAAPVAVEVEVDSEPEAEPEPEPVPNVVDGDVGVDTASELFIAALAESVESCCPDVAVIIENVVGFDIGICEVPALPLKLVPVPVDEKDIVARETAVRESVALPASPVAANDQVAVFTDGVAALSRTWLSARTAVREAMMMAAESFMVGIVFDSDPKNERLKE